MVPDPFSVGVTPLSPEQLHSLLPGGAGLAVLADGGMGVAEAVEGVGSFREVAEFAEQGDGLLVVVDGSVVVAGLVLDVAEAVERGRHPGGVVGVLVQGQRGSAVDAGGFVLAQAGGVPAHLVERLGFQRWLVEGAEEVEGAGGVLQGVPVIATQFPGSREYAMRVGLLGGVVVMFGQVQRLV
jgi:hypothetical protein